MSEQNDRVQKLILSEIQEVKTEVKEVRQTDIPNLKIEIAVMKQRTSLSAKVITGVGAAITLFISTVIAWFK